MNRRRFTLAAILPAAWLAGCHSQSKPSLDATLLHNENVRNAVTELDMAMNHLDMRLSSFNAENWQDALAGAESSATRLRNDIEQLKLALGYTDAT